jgi:two-component system response regulator AtoC
MGKYSILIVDDEINVTKLLGKFLKKEGYATLAAASGEEALNIIDSHQVDIVITDIKMPEMSGIELLSKINDIDPTIKVILITAFAAIETAVEALKMGALDYITKPFDLDDVLLSVEKIAAGLEKNDYTETIKEENGSIENFFSSKSIKMQNAIELMRQVSDTKSTVMVSGETGTGKELAAQIIHSLSSRHDKPFIKVNCAAIPENLLESELFGYEKGAFTGAVNSKPGRFELADTGTLFLDEVGDITPLMQVKLLRAVQEREFERLGGTETIKVDVRIITATNKNLENMVKEGCFRQDLYYRLNVVPITMPPLRERKEDIEQLIECFLKESSIISNKNMKKITKQAVLFLKNYNWPGNIRELANVIERCVVITSSNSIDVENLPDYILNFDESRSNFNEDDLTAVVDNAERNVIVKGLRECSGNRTRASEILGISRRSLHRKIIKYNIED